MRFLCGHYLALSSPSREGFVGLVQRGVSLTNIAQAAAMEAASICCSALGSCPEIRMSVDRSGDGLVAAVPEYVHYVLLELLKNAMRATMQAHGKGESESERREGVSARGGGGDGGERSPIVFADVPGVSISVRKRGADDVLLVVGDHGGGIPAEATDKVKTRRCYVVRFRFLLGGRERVEDCYAPYCVCCVKGLMCCEDGEAFCIFVLSACTLTVVAFAM